MLWQVVRTVSFASLLLLAACGGSSGGSAAPNQPPPPPPPPQVPSVSLQPVFTQLSFSQPVALKQPPGNGARWYVVEQSGVIRVFDNNQNASSASVALDISARVDSSFNESGLLGMAFHPSFPGTPEIFVSYTRTDNPLISYVSRFLTSNGGVTFIPGSEEVILTVIQDSSNHNGGDVAFGPDGFLYIGFGDGGGGGDPNDNAQNLNNMLGTIARIDVDGGTPYAIPASNPNFGNALCMQGSGAASCPETFAWGLRNPWRFSFDSATGDLWAGDVGQSSWEEVDRITNGGNYGWDDREGAHCFEPASGCATGSIDPITEYDRTLGTSITGGYVYRGTAVPDLVGQYVFGDFVSGRLFSIPANSQAGVVPSELLDSALNFSAFAEDIDGEIYVLQYANGTIHQIVASP
jgi:glucose/arabinose dehydrogenase